MKRNNMLLRTNSLIFIIILIGFACILFTNYSTYKKILEDDIENISRLTSSTIYAEIDNELTKPIFVAQTMANDSFLKTWLRQENASMTSPGYSDALQKYLSDYREKYQYDAVFMISAKSNIYYYFEGVNKTVSPENEHDDWYYDFLDSGREYRLNIDTDEVNQNELTVFVDCRIEDEDGALMGVTGVGLKMSRLQELLTEYENNFDLEAYLIDPDGLVKVHTDSSKIETQRIFEEPDIIPFQNQILQDHNSLQVFWYPEGQLDNCMITRYIENLKWFLIIEKDTKAIRRSFEILIKEDFIIVVIITALLLAIGSYIICCYNRQMMKLSTTDALTGLPNYKWFCDLYEKRPPLTAVGVLVFLFDIDHFKRINDTEGHLYGNQILQQIAELARQSFTENGMVARFGGDEFIGVLYDTEAEGMTRLEQFIKDVYKQTNKAITISAGAVYIQKDYPLHNAVEQADRALYAAKEKGRNQAVLFTQAKVDN